MDPPLKAPVMLVDIKENFQQLAASLPPDEWYPDPPRFYLQRQESGILSLSLSEVAVDGAVSANGQTSETLNSAMKEQGKEAKKGRPKGKRPGFRKLWRRLLAPVSRISSPVHKRKDRVYTRLFFAD